MSQQNDPKRAAPRDRAKGRDLRQLRQLWPFLRPYRLRILGAIVAATGAAGSVLALGRGIGTLIDQGFGNRNVELLNQALAIIILGTVVLAGATYARVSLVSRLGERVVGDIRRRLFDH